MPTLGTPFFELGCLTPHCYDCLCLDLLLFVIPSAVDIPWEACSFINENGGGMDMGEKGGRGRGGKSGGRRNCSWNVLCERRIERKEGKEEH